MGAGDVARAGDSAGWRISTTKNVGLPPECGLPWRWTLFPYISFNDIIIEYYRQTIQSAA